MKNFKQVIKQEILTNLSKLDSLKDRDNPLSSPEELWAETIANNIVGKYSPFISEVEEFNNTMGKSWQNRSIPTIDKADADFVVSFIEEELNELKEAVEENDIVGVLDALLDITYVGLGNGALVFGLKDKILEGYAEVQASNLSKICNTEEEAIETIKIRSEQQGEPCHYVSMGDKYVVMRTRDSKVMKSINYFSPNLKQFFTEEEIQSCKNQ